LLNLPLVKLVFLSCRRRRHGFLRVWDLDLPVASDVIVGIAEGADQKNPVFLKRNSGYPELFSYDKLSRCAAVARGIVGAAAASIKKTAPERQDFAASLAPFSSFAARTPWLDLHHSEDGNAIANAEISFLPADGANLT
jgi:hypothetical protein